MGYPIELFIDQDICEEFQCSICHGVLQDMKMINDCEHTFCKACIEEWQRKSFIAFIGHVTCPIDRRVITGFKDPQRPYVNLLNRLQMLCPFNELGCPVVMKLEAAAAHYLVCEFNPANKWPCPYGCGYILRRGQDGAHSCVEFLLDELDAKDLELEELAKAKDLELEALAKAKDLELEALATTKDLELEALARTKDLELEALAKAKDMELEALAKAKDEELEAYKQKIQSWRIYLKWE